MASLMFKRSRPPSRVSLALMLLGVLAAVSIVVLSNHTAQAGQKPKDLATGPRYSTAVAHPSSLGIPAISARPEIASSTGAHFTADDVKQYIATHRAPYAVPGSPAPVVVSVQFISAAAASALLDHEDIGVPDNDLVCLVRLSGSFQDDVPAGIQAGIFHDGEMVFDAYTGNLLVSSVG